jgi:arylsulfatase A-like enzyme
MRLLPALLISSALAFQTAKAADKPNIILINIDDLGYADISPFGGKVATPNLDRMAQEGMKLTSHYAAPVCSPSRAAMMTGCYPKRVLPIPGVLFPASAVGLSPDEVTIAEVMKPEGYDTACIGKWHLGDQPEFLPTAQGFDSYFGIPYSNDMGPRSDGAKSNPGTPIPPGKEVAGKGVDPQKFGGDETGLKGNQQPPLPMLDGNKPPERIKADGQHEMTRRYTERAVSYILEHQDKPFFLYLPHNAVHFPLYPHQDFMGKSGVSLQKDWVLEVDWCVGKILDALRELKLDARTLVIFTSDNGGPVNNGADNTPLRGAKGTTLEGGMRVCTVAWWPGHVPAASTSAAITSHMDWLPTFAALAGGKVPSDRKIDGMDLSGLLLGNSRDFKPRETFFYYRGFTLEAVRSGSWKLHLETNALYDLSSDLHEDRNLASTQAGKVAELTALSQTMKDDLGLKGEKAPGIRPLGRVKSPKPVIAP